MADVQEDSPIGGQGQAEGGAPAADEEAELAKLQAELYGGEGDGGDASEDPGSGAAQGDGEGGGEAAVMTKSQMKKKARLERMLAKRAESRQREKAVRAQRRAEANERKAAEWAGMSEEQKEAVRKEKQARLGAHKDAEKQLKERLKQSLETGPRIVIDLDWEKRMNENDLRHLVQQLSFSYAANKQVDRPAHMVLTSFKGGVAALANKLNPGMDKWFITRTEQHYGELFSSPEDKARLVYLTADAEDELDELDESKIYIIGGLVDHNRYKGLCEEQAQAAGIPTARLPINRYVQLASRAVLTVNHVFQILVEYYARRDWRPRRDKAWALTYYLLLLLTLGWPLINLVLRPELIAIFSSPDYLDDPDHCPITLAKAPSSRTASLITRATAAVQEAIAPAARRRRAIAISSSVAPSASALLSRSTESSDPIITTTTTSSTASALTANDELYEGENKGPLRKGHPLESETFPNHQELQQQNGQPDNYLNQPLSTRSSAKDI
ncbi:hypothetical protein VOLCADRAFT_120245, partial [Volvox carteri f. nagariensis]